MATYTLSTSTSLIILYAIVLAEASLDIVSEKTTFKVGDTIVINCTTVTHSAQSVQWFFNSNPIPEKQYTVFSADLSQLVIPYSNFSNAGNYSCALLEASFEEIATVQIQVGEKPHPVSSFNCFSFNGVDILCTWDDGGPTNIPTTSTLMYKGLYAAPSKPGYDWTACPDSGTSVNCPDLHSYTHSCFIYGYDHHCGSRHNFTVIAENALGTAATWIWFNPEAEAVPFAPSNTTAVAESGECVAVSWDYPCGWEHPEYVGYFSLQYRLRYKSQWDADKWGNLISQEYKKEKRVCQLEGYTHYSIQLSAGLTGQTKYWSHWSDIIVVRTLEQAPISHLEISYENVDNPDESSKRDVTVHWKPLGVREMKGEVLGYTITMSKEGENIKISVNASANTTSQVLQGLEKYASYNIQVVTFNSAGSSPPSSLTILDLAQAPSEPLQVSAVAIDKDSILLRWKPPEYPRGSITEYNIYWRSSSSELSLDGSTQELLYEVEGLKEYVLYEFYVQAYTAVGGGGRSQAVFQYTKEGVPSGPPKHIQIMSVDKEPSSLQVTWQPPCSDDRNGIIRGYILHFCEAENMSTSISCRDNSTLTQNVSAVVTTQLVSAEVTTQLENLKPFTPYIIWLAAYTGVGVPGPNSTMTWNRTAQGTPSAPLEVFVTSQSSTEVGLEWQEPWRLNGIIKEYRVNYKSDNHDGSYSSDQTRIVLKELLGYTNYTIKVQACTNAVTAPCGDFSSEIYAKTLIGVPGKPNPPSVKLQSSREVVVTPNAPSIPNGPVEHLKYVVFYKGSNDHGDYKKYKNQRTTDQQTTGNSFRISVDCADFEDDEEFVFATKAVHSHDGKMLISEMSEPSQPVPLCHFMPDIALIVAMIIVGTILVIIMLVLVIYCRKKYNKSEYALPIPDAKLPTSVTPPESPTEKVEFFEAREVYDVLQNQKVHQNGDGPIARYQRQSSGGHSDTSATSATHLIRQTNPDAPIDEDEDEDEDEVFPLQFQNFHKKQPLRIHIPRRYMNHQDPAEGLLALQSPDSGIIAGSPGYSGTAGSLPLAEERSISSGKESMSDYLHMVEFGQGNNSLPNDQNASRLMSFDSGISYSDSSPDALMTPLTLSELLPFEGSKSDNEISIDGVSSRARKNKSIKGLNEIVPLTDIIVMNVHGVLSEDDITDDNDTIANDAGLVPSNGKGKIDMSPVQHVTEGDIPTSNGDSDNPATPVLLDNPGYITSNAVDTSQSSSHDSNSAPLYVNGGTNQHYVNTVN